MPGFAFFVMAGARDSLLIGSHCVAKLSENRTRRAEVTATLTARQGAFGLQASLYWGCG